MYSALTAGTTGWTGFPPGDPRFGRHYFHSFYGPSTYSFDRGEFHFIALDTHRAEPHFFDADAWSHGKMEPRVRDWLEADLSRATDGRTLVVLNHEPFHEDPNWGDYVAADDEGLLEAHGVDYVLAGHLHRNGELRQGATTHVTTGALSGLRWLLPASLHERGYRLFYARDGRLHHAWKQTGKRLIAFAPSLEPGSTEVVVALADRAAPFASAVVRLDGKPLSAERWGSYFLLVDPGPRSSHRAKLRVHARTVDGETAQAMMIWTRTE